MVTGSDHTSKRRVLVTGAGSGTGRAVAEALAATHDLVLLGRRADRLTEAADAARAAGAAVTARAFDVTADDPRALLDEIGPVDDLVLSAGLNAPRRAWADQRMDEFEAIVATNLTAPARMIDAALPALRAASGTVVIVSSIAAWKTSPGAGVAYRASKRGLRALSDSLNEQEAAHGVRASIVCPGDIDTEFLHQRPSPPRGAALEVMLSPADVARAIRFILDSPPHVRIDELVISPLGTVAR
ncbi:SDR family NAD(P)-dependent oxidoreductase [Microbacterium barkeri]|uniref:SDR family oxidoreductase n=1 Tax=Microbacterium barkeri TaxID=33917 RepID=UPI0024AEA830|nr:SDR family NAD(P)-dependent oxidoreductase [Microbacterium barkeri]MDI6943344.1 SDR family NAD(P)-dependent oxidoreductase [Microbacterium barkeri]